MANTPESIAALWKIVEEEKITVPSEVWAVWREGCLKQLAEIRNIVEKNQGKPIPASDAEMIGKKAYVVQKFIRSIKRSEDGRSCIQDDRVHMEDHIRDLVAHYIGNDLYKVSLIADIYGLNPDPLTPENGEIILKNVNAIMDFVELLKSRTSA